MSVPIPVPVPPAQAERALVLALARRWSALPPDVRDAALAWTDYLAQSAAVVEELAQRNQADALPARDDLARGSRAGKPLPVIDASAGVSARQHESADVTRYRNAVTRDTP